CQRGRLYYIGGIDVPQGIQDRRELLRHQRSGGTRKGYAQIRVALSRRPDRALPAAQGPLYGAVTDPQRAAARGAGRLLPGRRGQGRTAATGRGDGRCASPAPDPVSLSVV